MSTGSKRKIARRITILLHFASCAHLIYWCRFPHMPRKPLFVDRGRRIVASLVACIKTRAIAVRVEGLEGGHGLSQSHAAWILLVAVFAVRRIGAAIRIVIETLAVVPRQLRRPIIFRHHKHGSNVLNVKVSGRDAQIRVIRLPGHWSSPSKSPVQHLGCSRR